jgi:hypothetical protein
MNGHLHGWLGLKNTFTGTMSLPWKWEWCKKNVKIAVLGLLFWPNGGMNKA